jgi:hypothetical protein
MLCIMVRADSPQRELERDSSRGCAFEVQNMSTTTRRPMSKSPTESMTRIMQEKPAKAMAEIKAKRRTNRGAPRRARKYRPCKHQAHRKEARKNATKTGPAAQKRDPPTVRQ